MRKVLVFSILLLVSVSLSGCSPFANPKAGLQVVTNDVSSSVFINDQYLEKTPYIGKELKPGSYTVRIQPDDETLVSYETSVQLRKGLLTVITWKPGTRPETSGGVVYEMEKLANKKHSEIFITSLPDGAVVSLDNQAKDFTPLIVDTISPGRHEFEVSLPSYETQKHTINVIDGHRMNVTVKLAKIDTQSIPATPNQNSPTQATDDKQLQATDSAQVATPSASSKPVRQAVDQSATPYIKIKPTNFFQGGEEVLRVRDKPKSSGKELGFAVVGESYPYLQELENDWYKIEFKNQEGWVSNQYSELVK